MRRRGVQQLENRRVGADPQSERQKRNCRKGRVAAQLPQTIPNVPEEVLNEADAAHVAALLLNPLDAPKEPQRSISGLFGWHPRRQVLLDLAVEMKLKLVVELLFFLASPEEGTN